MKEAVTVVTTVKNEAGSIRRLFEALGAQTRPPDEIVVVDGGSTDGTPDMLEEAAASLATPVQVIRSPGATISRGRNEAIAAARTAIVAVCDAGTVPAQTWLEHLVQPLERDDELAVSSGFYEPSGRSWFERCLTTVITPQLPEIDPEMFLPSSRSVAFRKEWWERVGGYPEWLRHCEDLVFDLDLRRAGARFAFASDAVVAWEARASLPSFFRQYFAYARGDGHALLWTTRHAVRYSAYSTGLMLLAGRRRSRLAVPALVAGAAVHFGKYLRRVGRRPPWSNRAQLVASFAVTPVLVVVGDVAKMIGYPVGRVERWSGTVQTPGGSDR